MTSMSQGAEVRSWSLAGGGAARAVRRPDGAWLLRLPAEHPAAWPLVQAATQDGCATLVVDRPADQSTTHERALWQAGFSVDRTETRWLIPLAALPLAPARTPHVLQSVTECDPGEVADLDNAIRDETPGTAGWSGTGSQLADTLDDPEFDPALFLVARHPRTGQLDGLIRVWNRQPEPRLGCLGVTPPWRRSSLALLLLQNVAGTLRDRGVTQVSAETDDTNHASQLLVLNHGGTAVETVSEWRRSSPPCQPRHHATACSVEQAAHLAFPKQPGDPLPDR